MGDSDWNDVFKPADDWRERVYQERHALEIKIQKLNMFLREVNGSPFDSRISGDEIKRLMEQMRCMELYHDALTDRIFNFEVFDETN